MRRRSAVALGALAVILAGHHLAVVFTESVNWDELSFLSRVADTLRTGQLNGGGRPGLAVIPALPFVAGCDDAIATARSVRLFWSLFAIGYVAGLVVFLRRLFHGVREQPLHDAAFGAALLVLVPVWLRWSVQLRTDQGALFFATWGAVALLYSRRKPALALAAGLAWGIGFLFTQKLIYAGALFGWLCLAECLWKRDCSWRREAVRSALLLAGGAAAYAGFALLVPLFFEPYQAHSVGKGLDVFKFYRAVLGFRVYRGMVPSVLPQLALAVAFVPLAAVAVRRGEWRWPAAGAGALVLGVAVGLFHAGAFPYFWMTLGLFFAVLGAITLEPLCKALPDARTRRLVAWAIWGALLLPTLPAALGLLSDSQQPQREALAFVDRNFPAEARGFHPEGALYCRQDPEPFSTYFSQHIRSQFFGDDGPANVESFLREFIDRPVAFIVSSYRLAQFPPGVLRFWDAHYLRYGPNVFIPGFRLTTDGPSGPKHRLNVLVPGAYRFIPVPANPAARLTISGNTLAPGDTIELPRGAHQATVQGNTPAILAWAVDVEPTESSPGFYGADMKKEFDLGHH